MFGTVCAVLSVCRAKDKVEVRTRGVEEGRVLKPEDVPVWEWFLQDNSSGSLILTCGKATLCFLKHSCSGDWGTPGTAERGERQKRQAKVFEGQCEIAKKVQKPNSVVSLMKK